MLGIILINMTTHSDNIEKRKSERTDGIW